jgi:hypothetical protein
MNIDLQYESIPKKEDWPKKLAVKLLKMVYGPLNKKYCFYFKFLSIFWFTCIILAIMSTIWIKSKHWMETFISLFMIILYFGIYFLQNYILYDMCKNTLTENMNTKNKDDCKSTQQYIFDYRFQIKQLNKEIAEKTQLLMNKYNQFVGVYNQNIKQFGIDAKNQEAKFKLKENEYQNNLYNLNNNYNTQINQLMNSGKTWEGQYDKLLYQSKTMTDHMKQVVDNTNLSSFTIDPNLYNSIN